VNTGYKSDFIAFDPVFQAFNYCKSIGARSLHVESKEEQEMISQYFHEWNQGNY
jgi:hypothetical protein